MHGEIWLKGPFFFFFFFLVWALAGLEFQEKSQMVGGGMEIVHHSPTWDHEVGLGWIIILINSDLFVHYLVVVVLLLLLRLILLLLYYRGRGQKYGVLHGGEVENDALTFLAKLE